MLQGEHKVREKPIGFLYKQKISWVNHQYKLISLNKGETFALYDLIKDKSEQNDIIAAKAEIAVEMKKELFVWLNSVENSKNGMDYK